MKEKRVLSDLSWLDKESYTDDPEIWWGLLTEIYKTAFADYKNALREKIMKGGRGAIKGEHFLIRSSEKAVKVAALQVKYDLWRSAHHCGSCAISETKCPHRVGYVWKQFTDGKDTWCRREDKSD